MHFLANTEILFVWFSEIHPKVMGGKLIVKLKKERFNIRIDYMVDKNCLHYNAVTWTHRKILFKDLCVMF